MTQKEQVIEAMKKNSGYATFKQLNQLIDFSQWKTHTPEASVRRIVQVNEEFVRIKPGLWALRDYKDDIQKKFELDNKSKNDSFTHYYYQGLIVELGNIRRRKTIVPNGDRNRMFLEKPLSELVSEKELPLFTYEKIAKRAATVDVIWLNERNMPCGFFEVEHTTNITNSLDKFYELQDFRADFWIIADEHRRKSFNAYIERSLYSEISEYVKFMSYDDLVKQYEHASFLSNMNTLL